MNKRVGTLAMSGLVSLLAACGGGSGNSPPAQTTQVAGVVGGTANALTFAGQPLAVSGPVTVNGAAASVAAIKPGSVIVGSTTAVAAARATSPSPQPRALQAEGVDVQVEIQGLVDSINLSAGTLQVVGQTVTTDALTVLERQNPDHTFSSITLADIAPGSFVEVSGQPAAAGGIVATRVELQPKASGDPTANQVEVRGIVASLDSTAKTFSLGADTVNYSSATVEGTLANDVRVEVHGTRSGTTIAASRVEVKGARSGEAGQHSELEGVVQQLDTEAKTFHLLDFTVDYSAIVPAPTLANGARVEIQGTFDATNTALVHATALHVENSHGGDGSANGEVKGQVASVDTTALTLTVGSTNLWADANTVVEQNDQDVPFSQLQVGQWVEARFDSTRLQAGASYATRIEIQGQVADGGSVEVKGPVSSFNGPAQTLVVNGKTVAGAASTVYQLDDQTLTASQFWGTDRTGATVEVQGTLSGTTITATRIEARTST